MDAFGGLLLYLLTISTTLAMISFFPVVLLVFGVDYWRNRRSTAQLIVAISIGIGFLAGALIGWTFRPSGWSLSFLDTLWANFADHSIEHAAERMLLFVLASGSVVAWIAGIVAAIAAMWRNRHVPKCA